MTPEYLKQLAQGLGACYQGELRMALEGAATEIITLREENETWQNQGLLEQCNRQADMIERLNGKLHNLEDFMDSAPHGNLCAAYLAPIVQTTGYPDETRCDCWKRRYLEWKMDH